MNFSYSPTILKAARSTSPSLGREHDAEKSPMCIIIQSYVKLK